MHEGSAQWRQLAVSCLCKVYFTLANRLFARLKGALFVLWLALKLVSCLCLSEKRRVLNSQGLFVLPGLRHSAVVDLVGLFSFGVLDGVFINVMKEIRGFRGPGVTSGISIFL